jgi:hypothetical protein
MRKDRETTGRVKGNEAAPDNLATTRGKSAQIVPVSPAMHSGSRRRLTPTRKV